MKKRNMKLIHNKPIKAFRNYSKLLSLLILLVFTKNLTAQEETKWIEIVLTDTIENTAFAVSTVFNAKYPPAHLFDSKLNTCWVSGTEKSPSPHLFLQLPKLNNPTINIFSGYGKSKMLYLQNSRPKKLRLSIFAAINPDGYVSEHSMLFKAIQFRMEQIVHLADSFGIQSINLSFYQKDLDNFKESVYASYDSTFKIPKAKTALILKMEILETYAGNKYDDVCISEIFFNDRLIISQPQTVSPIGNVYLNEAENTVLVDGTEHRGELLYSDTLSVLQIVEVSKNKRWAILISMPAEIEGRAETSYLLFDLSNKSMLNTQLEKYTGNYLSGDEMYFESDEKGLTHLNYLANDGTYHKIELKISR